MSARMSWAAGSARFTIERQTGTGLLVTAVECRVGADPDTYPALLDTGAQWSMIGGDLAKRLRPSDVLGPQLTMSTRVGRFVGTLERVAVHLLTEPGCGADLFVDATVVFAPTWEGPIVLGTRGLLERVRFELDPDHEGADCWWSFAPGR